MGYGKYGMDTERVTEYKNYLEILKTRFRDFHKINNLIKVSF